MESYQTENFPIRFSKTSKPTEELRRLQRFANLGRMSAGICHDLTNLVSGLSLAVDHISKRLSEREDKETKQYIRMAISSSRRASEALEHFKTYIKERVSTKRFIANLEVKKTIKTLSYKAQVAQVKLKFEAKSEVILTHDLFKLNQVLSNLILNAIEACASLDNPERKLVTITLLDLGSEAVFKIKDWGPGFKPSERTKIFEPFFTTKRAGTGLGLSTAKEVAECNLGGTLMASSDNLETTFTLSIPKQFDPQHISLACYTKRKNL